MTSRAEAEGLDAADPLGHLRERFMLPPGVIYLDGNSLGPLQHRVVEALNRVTGDEWGNGLIRKLERGRMDGAAAEVGRPDCTPDRSLSR